MVGQDVESAYIEPLMFMGSGRNVVPIAADEPKVSAWMELVRKLAPSVTTYQPGRFDAVMGKVPLA
jgi:hypothetical protein